MAKPKLNYTKKDVFEEFNKRQAAKDEAEEKFAYHENIIEINPTDELEKMNSYKEKIPGLEIDSDVTNFWQSQDNEVKEFKSHLTAAKNEFMPIYNQIPDFEESLESKQRQSAKNKKIYKENLKTNEKNRQEAEKAFQKLKREISPFKVYFFSKLTGNDEELQRFKKAKEQITSTNLQEQKLKKEYLEGSREAARAENKLLYKIQDARLKLLDIDAKVNDITDTAKKVDANSRKKQPIMQAQYNVLEIVSKNLKNIKKIQPLKKNPIVINVLQRDNRELAEQLQQVPENLPEVNLRISFENPLTLDMLKNLNADKLQETREKMEKIERNLRKDSPEIDLTNTNNTLERYQLKEDETLQTVTDKLNDTSVTLTAEERNILEMKREYLQLQEKEKEISNSISDLLKKLNQADPSQVKQLNNLQSVLKAVRQEMEKTPYNKTVNALKEYETLKNQAQTLEQPQNLEKFETILNGLERAGIDVQSFNRKTRATRTF